MRKTLTYAVLLIVCTASTFYFLRKDSSTEIIQAKLKEPTEENAEESEHFDNVDKLLEQETMLTRDPRLNRVPRERLLAAKRIKDEKIARMEAAMAVPGVSWTERGPNNVGGRSRALWFDLGAGPSYNKVWTAGVAGGLWFTNDITVATPVWTKVNDFFDNIAISCFAQDPLSPNTMYFGTGEGWLNADAVQGLGIWKSTDGGANWSQLPSTSNFFYVQDLLIDNNGNLFASLRTNNLGGGSNGVHKSTDGGVTWTKVLGSPVFGSSPSGADLELAANGDIYASLGVSGSNGGIYRSPAGLTAGDLGTWANITPNAAGGAPVNPTNFWHRIELATAPSDANVVYALFQGSGSSNCTSIQQYNAGTNTWTVRAVPTIIDQGSNSNFTRGQAFYDLIAAVDPNNAASLYIGGIDALRSDNNGASWTQMTAWSLANSPGFAAAQNVHADHHAIVYAPGSSSRAIWGTDGGIYYTANANVTGAGAKPTYTAKNIGYNITQFYGCAIHPTSANYFLAGAQDNGSHRFTTAGVGNTTMVTGGDGGFTHIDQDNGNVQITSYVRNEYYVSTNNGASFTNYFKNSRGSFINPTDYDNLANIMYGGDNGGFYFRWNSPEANGPDAQVAVTNFAGGTVTHVAVSPVTLNRVYFGLNNGSVVRVDNAHTGTSQTGVIVKPTTPGVVSCVAIDPANENHLLVTYSSYGVNHILETTNGLAATPTWTNVTGNFPDMPVRWAMFDPRNPDWALLATELGVWSTDNLDGASTDWDPTNTGLANVRVDMLQYRNSDRTIAAATHGRGLFTATIPNVTTPNVNFELAGTGATEQTTATASCRNYTDYTVVMTIDNAPAGNATITLNIDPGGTATQGVDFDFTTNGNFASPSNILTFANGVTTPQNVTVRVYNDAEVEQPESFTFSYSISGATNAQTGTWAQLHTFSIADNDIPPGTDLEATIGAYNADLVAPFRGQFSDGRSQMLYLASELKAQGLTAGTITDFAFAVTSKASAAPFNGFTVKMKNTSTTSLTGGGAAFEGGTTTVFGPVNYSTILNTNVITLTTPFVWDGNSNLLVEMCFDNAAAAQNDFVAGTSGIPLMQLTSMNGASGCSMPNANTVFGGGGARPLMAFAITANNAVESALNSSRSEYLGPNSDVYFYSADGELLARIHNLSNHDYGCTQVVIDRAGIGSTQFWNNNTANYLMDKTLRVIPTNNNPSGQFEITLYYTASEVAGWETATGQSFNNIQMVKIPSQISNVTPANHEPDGPGTVQIVDPVRGSLSSSRTLTFTFANGFSGFGAGLPGSALPVVLVDFNGKLRNNSAILDWKTSSEQNSRGFDVERSYDGATFSKIGYVAAAGNSVTERSYRFTDRDIAQDNNYYRLKQIDLDGKFVYSKVIVLKYEPGVTSGLKLLKNPVQDNLDIEFSSIPNGKVQMRLVDLNGRILVNWQNPRVTQRRIRISLADKHIARGVYIVNIMLNGKNYSERILKE